MNPNHPTAVMARRRSPRASLDFFPTPGWATRALCDRLDLVEGMTCVEPAAGAGHMVDVLEEYFESVAASDIVDYGRGYPTEDFLTAKAPGAKADWVITTPPFRLAEQFALTAPKHARNWALLCRLSWLEGGGRYQHIWASASFPPVSETLVFSERVPMVKGRLATRGESSATAYAWFVWREGDGGSRISWVPPGAKKHRGAETLFGR